MTPPPSKASPQPLGAASHVPPIEPDLAAFPSLRPNLRRRAAGANYSSQHARLRRGNSSLDRTSRRPGTLSARLSASRAREPGLEAPPPRPPLGGGVGGASLETASRALLGLWGGASLEPPEIAPTLNGCSLVLLWFYK